MKWNQSRWAALALLAVTAAAACAQQPFEADWQSLAAHTPVPEWMRDAKFGIYCHWGVYSVLAYGNEQYTKNMYMDEDDSQVSLMGVRRRQEAMYGPLTEFGYHDFIPMFRAEKFDADEWAQLFRESGARFAGLVAEHHDGFAMWNSRHTPFNAKRMGPKRDVTGQLAQAVRRQGMKFMLSLHHENNYYYARLKPGMAGYDRKYARLYGFLMPRAEWYDMWLNKCCEVVDKYSPDLIYFDAWMDSIPEQHKLRFLAHYFNHARRTGQEVIFTYKFNDFPRTIGMLDHEQTSPNEIDPEPWLCDYTIADGYHRSWGYVKGMQLHTPRDIIHKLVEVVSNNGQLLLNLSPRADGTFPQDQKDVVANVGVWLWSYGESIYGTRPHLLSHETLPTGERVFYTRKGRSIYAIFLDWPGTGRTLPLEALNMLRRPGAPLKATLLSVKRNYDCPAEAAEEALLLTIPAGARMPSDVAQVVRIDF